MNHKILRILKEKDVADVGIGAMIVFIAMVLVAGIAASVLIQTATKLESQAMATGQETIGEVATGLAVFDIEGYSSSVSANISKLLICVRPRAGSTDIDLNQVFVELADPTMKVVLRYNNTFFAKRLNAGFDDIFNQAIFPGEGMNYSAAQESGVIDDFGILVVEDADRSISGTNPVINRGDKVMLAVYTYHCFNESGSQGLRERKAIWGAVVPELGSPGIISFVTPAAYNSKVMDLQ
ncbi:MAG: flagellin [Candidatus Thermoplasmatota archaeon]